MGLRRPRRLLILPVALCAGSRYLVSEFREERRLFDRRVVDLGVGTFGVDHVTTLSEDTPLFKVLEVLKTFAFPKALV